MRMLNNLRTDISDQSCSLDGTVQQSSSLVQRKMQNLTINNDMLV